MGGLLAGLATLAQPILARVLLALGLSVLTITGVSAVITQITDLLMSKIGGIPMASVQLAGLAGIWEGLGIMLGSVTFTAAYWAATKAVRLASGGT